MGIKWNSAQLDPHLAKRLDAELKKAERNPRSVRKAGERAPGKYDANAEPEGRVDNPNDLSNDYHASTKILTKDIGAILVKHYPGWDWVVQVNEIGQMIEIFNYHCHTKYAYRIRMVDIMNDPLRRLAVVGGGEILERFGLPRGGFGAEAQAMVAFAYRDVHGNLIPDISDLADKKQRLNAEIARKMAAGEITIVEQNGVKYARVKNV